MNRGRSIIRFLCIAGLLTCIVAVIAPAAYGDEGILEDATDPPAVDTSTVTEVTESVPSVEEAVQEVDDTTAPVTEAVGTAEVSTEPVAEPVEVVEETASTSVSASTSTPETQAPSVDVPGATVSDDSSATTGGTDGSATVTDGATTSGSSSTDGSSPSAGTGSFPATRPGQMSFELSSSPAQRVFLAAAGDNPENILDELLDIGNSIGVDQVRGLQITTARGDTSDVAPAGSDASMPAPLALTGIAIGAFLAIGVALVAAGGGARAAGGTSAA
jgi:hypothetical protein